LERKRKQAETFAEKLEAQDDGTDLERKQAWQYSIADNEAWDKKLAKKARRSQFEFTG
jgi:pre-mRNA-splicing factor SYF2